MQTNMQPLETRVFKYHGQCKSHKYNMFFNPNICHVCKSTESNLIPCKECYLIFYCNNEHKQLHYRQHAEFCKIIRFYAVISPPTDGFITWLEWMNKRKDILNRIPLYFRQSRQFDVYMKDMILFAKSCIVCHQQVELRCCQHCFSANYCVRHEEDFRTAHDENECRQLTLLMNIESMTGIIIDDFSYEFLWLLHRSNFLNMNCFCTQYVLNTRRSEHLLAKDYFQSYYFSQPLTVYHELISLDPSYFINRRSYVIHIIATECADKYENNLGAWELFIHLSGIEKLTIVVVGMQKGNCNFESSAQLCEKCTADNKQLQFIFRLHLYHEYIVASRNCEQFLNIWRVPNIITAFEINLNEDENGENFITRIQRLSCKLLLTSAFQHVIEANIDFVERVLRITIFSRSNLNRFASLLPRLDWETGRTTVHNKYSFICTNLTDKSNEKPHNSTVDLADYLEENTNY